MFRQRQQKRKAARALVEPVVDMITSRVLLPLAGRVIKREDAETIRGRLLVDFSEQLGDCLPSADAASDVDKQRLYVAALLLARSMATHTITAAEPARKGQSDHKVMMSLRYLDSHCIITAQEWFKPAVVTKLQYHLHGTRETSVQSRVMAALPASFAPVWGRLLSSRIPDVAQILLQEDVVFSPDVIQSIFPTPAVLAASTAAVALVRPPPAVMQAMGARMATATGDAAALKSQGTGSSSGSTGHGFGVVYVGPPASNIRTTPTPVASAASGPPSKLAGASPVTPSTGSTTKSDPKLSSAALASVSASSTVTVGQRWSVEEDYLLYEAVKRHGLKWNKVAEDMVGRGARQCSDRWRRYGELIEKEKAGEIVRDKTRRSGGLPIKTVTTFLDPSFDATVASAAAKELKREQQPARSGNSTPENAKPPL